MISCAHKVIEPVLAASISKELKVYGRHFGFQRGLPPKITLLNIDAVVRVGRNIIATLDLAEVYDRLNRSTLLGNSKRALNKELTDMLTACRQVLRVTTKGDALGKEAYIILGLTQGAPLSSVLFLIYIDDLQNFCRKETDQEVMVDELESAEITLTADDAVIYTTDWKSMQIWLDAFSRWVSKKEIKWENSKCKVICRSNEEAKDENIRLYIDGGLINKATSAT